MTAASTTREGRGGNGRQPVALRNTDAEAALLGAALYSPAAAETLVEYCRPDDFADPANAHIAAAIHTLLGRGAAADAITVADLLEREGLLEAAGGPVRISFLPKATPVSGNAVQYATIVARDARQRQARLLADDVAHRISEGRDWQDELARLVDLAAAETVGLPHNFEEADIAAILRGDHDLEEAFWWRRDDGRALIYPGRMHWLQAEPSLGKSWIALALVVEVLAAGGSALYLDWEDVPIPITSRLLALGADPAALADRGRYRYFNPAGAVGPAERALLTSFAEQRFDVVICDGVAEALARDGLDENKAPDVVSWVEKVPRPLARAGAAVLMLDHVVKDPDQARRYARGTGAKLAAVDGAAYTLVSHRPFTREQAGMVRLIVQKDRPGAVGAISETVAHVHVTPRDGGQVVEIAPRVPDPRQTEFHPTGVMGKITRLLDEAGGVPLGVNDLARLLPGNHKKTIAKAVDDLVIGGYVSRRIGSNRKHLLTLIRPFSEDEAGPEELF